MSMGTINDPAVIDASQQATHISLLKGLVQIATALGLKDAGPVQSVTRLFTTNADISTARDITAAPAAGQKITAIDILISVETACYLTVQMETSGNVLWGGYMQANSVIQLTPRGYLKGDAADKKLQMKSSVASKGACTCIYFSEA